MITIKSFTTFGKNIGDEIEKFRRHLEQQHKTPVIVSNMWSMDVQKIGGAETEAVVQYIGGDDIGLVD